LTDFGLDFGSNGTPESRSHAVYQFLLSRQSEFAIIHFTSSSGVGYYPLLARKQGLFSPKSKIVIGLDILTQGSREILESENPNYLVTDVVTLKLDFMQQKSV